MSGNTTQLLLVARVERLISLAEETNTRLQNMEERLQNVEGRLQNVEVSQDAFKTQLENLDAKVEKRLQDTRPIWESVQARLADLDKKFDGIGELRTEMDSRFTKLDTDIQELRTETASGFRATGRKIGVLVENLVSLTADIRELQDRIEKIESHPV
jgi:chromosome segregation ATPase